MIRVEHAEVFNFEGAIRGLRNPMNSWDKSDTIYGEYHGLDENGREILVPYNPPRIGDNDLDLMQRLYKAGHPHRKYLRQIMVSMDITAPLYWWKEFDTYKVGTTANSCSTMHKIHEKEFTLDDFSHEHLTSKMLNEDDDFGYDSMTILQCVIDNLNYWRNKYLVAKKIDNIVDDLPSAKTIWWQMIQLLPSSYNQTRTITMNYENVFNILQYRQNHKLDEWNTFCDILLSLPYVRSIQGEEEI